MYEIITKIKHSLNKNRLFSRIDAFIFTSKDETYLISIKQIFLDRQLLILSKSLGN